MTPHVGKEFPLNKVIILKNCFLFWCSTTGN
jgi:hypothetical protein